jgi:hypothetical protein
MDIEIIESLEEFKAEVDRLSGAILLAKDNRIAELLSKGRPAPKRISLEELDLSDYMSDMLRVHKTLQWKAHNPYLGIRIRSARSIALSGICELIKAEYIGNFWDIYKKHIGWGADSTCYNWIWEAAFKEAGIDLILGQGGYRREFVQTLVLESGIPKKGRKIVIDFFILYWRYFRHQQDVEKLVNAIVEESIDLNFIPDDDRKALASLCKSAEEFSKAFSHAIEKLKTVFAYIENSEDILSGELADYTETIYRDTGVDIGDVLRGENQLRSLYERILGLVTPEKLRRIMKSAVPGTRIIIPDGTSVRVDEYEHILYGEHKLKDAAFSCVPTLSYTVSDLKNLDFNKIMRDGNQIVLKSRSKIYPVINGKERPDLVSAFYLKGKLGNSENCGNIFHGVLYPAMTIDVLTADGSVRESFSELDGFYCSPTFQHVYKDKKHHLFLYFPSFRLKATDLAGNEISIVSDRFSGSLFELQLDNLGFGIASDQEILLPEPHEESIKIWASDSSSSAPVIINGNGVEIEIVLESAMLFRAFGNRQFPIRPKNVSSRIGSKRFLLFISKNEEYSIENMTIINRAECGKYRVLTIEWKDIEKACQISVGNREWKFEHCVDLNLYLRKIAPHSVEFLDLNEKQGISPREFELVIYPVPSEKTKEELFWNIIVNNNDPVRIRFTKGPKGHSDGRTLRFAGKEIDEILDPFWKTTGAGNAVIEISLSTSDLFFNSVRFWLLPALRITAAKSFRDGDEVILQFQIDQTDKMHSILMIDNRGRSKASLRLEYKDGQWGLLKKEFSGLAEIKHLGTSLHFRSVPKVHGIFFGSRSKQEASDIRNLLKKELSDIDLIVSPQIIGPLLFRINDKIVETKSINSADLIIVGLDQVNSIIKYRKNKVEVQAGKESAIFSVGYDLEIENIRFHNHLIGDSIIGKVSFVGPEKSALCFSILRNPDAANENEIMSYEKECDGQYHKDYAINIPVTLSEIENTENLKILLTLKFDKNNSDEFYAYGESWIVESIKMIDEEDYEIIKENVISCLKENRYFEAKRYIKMGQNAMPSHEAEWVEQSLKKIDKMIRLIQVQSVASQIVTMLRKEFLN